MNTNQVIVIKELMKIESRVTALSREYGYDLDDIKKAVKEARERIGDD